MDIVTAGYPCQPFSVAGKRLGNEDPRHLWPHVARIIGEVEPPFVFLENVAHHLRLGFPEVASGLVGMGYRLAAGLFTAAEVGAAHKRERLFILAICEGDELADPARLLWHPLERRQPDGDDAAVADAEGQRQREPADETDAVAGSGPTWDEPRDDSGDVANAADRQFPQPAWRAEGGKGSGPHGAGLADANGKRRLQAERGQPQDGRPDSCKPDVDDTTARDHKDGATTLANTPVNGLLGRQVLVMKVAGSDTSEPRRTLNPLFVEALMGWPTGWTGFASVATEWSPWLRRMRCELWRLNCWPMDEVAG